MKAILIEDGFFLLSPHPKLLLELLFLKIFEYRKKKGVEPTSGFSLIYLSFIHPEFHTGLFI